MSYPNTLTSESRAAILASLALIRLNGFGYSNQQIHRKMTRPFRVSSQRSLINVYLAIIFINALWISPASGTITVISQLTNTSIIVFEDQPARFVPERVSAYGIQGYVVYANPPNACTTLDPPPQDFYPLQVNWIVVARRFDCDFQKKIENAQSANYAAIIVHNVGSNATEAMGADNPSKLVIYASFIGEYDGLLLRDLYSFQKHKEYYIRIQDDFSLNGYLLPFAIVVGVCFIVMLFFMLWQQVARWMRERRRSRRRKLPSSALKKIPVSKWTKGDPYETCAICLEDFVEQDRVRILPCSHGYHSMCIDPWLTKGRRVCPICKRKIILADESLPHSHSDSDTDDETAPLLGSAMRNPGSAGSSSSAPNIPSASSSTFVQPEIILHRSLRRARVEQLADSACISEDISSTIGGSSQNGDTLTTHRSLPVMAQVHSLQLRKFSTQSQSRVDLDLYRNSSCPLANSGRQSQFYVSCHDECPDEEMLDISVEAVETTQVTEVPSAEAEIREEDEDPTVIVIEGASSTSSPVNLNVIV